MAARIAAAPRWDPAALAASPWFGSVHHLLARLPDRSPTLDDLNALARKRGVRTGGGGPLAFVPPGAAEEQYEVRVFRTGEVPTRTDGWHDLFNALAWLAFPRTKATLNRIHHDELGRRPAAGARGTARDVVTLFDEGGVIVACADPSLAGLLEGFRWKELFVTRRAEAIAGMRFLVFGHAILERALAPYKGVTAKALVVAVAPEALALPPAALVDLLDARAADHFARAEAVASTRSLHPLPVLGIPGWAAGNADASYYEDESVFRPGRDGRAGARSLILGTSSPPSQAQGSPVAKPNYAFAKRQRDLAKKQKKEAKQRRRIAERQERPTEPAPPHPTDGGTTES